MKKRLIIISVLLVSLLVGCGSASKSNSISSDSIKEESKIDYGMSDSTAMEGENPEYNSESGNTNTVVDTERKVIKRAELTLETDNFDEVMAKIENYVNEFNGFVESSNVYQDGINSNNYKKNRSAEFIIRVPKDNFDLILNKYGSLGVVTNKRLYGDDVSSQYFDKESRLKVLEAQEKRYLEILEKTQNITEVIEVEKALTEVRYEIESITGYLKKMDNLISLSTVNLYVYEVSKTNEVINEPKTLGEKIINTFNNSITALGEVAIGLVLFIVAVIPFLIIPAIIAVVVIVIVKKNKKVKGQNKEKE